MQSTIRKVMRDARTWTILLALALTAGAADIFATRTAEQGAGRATAGAPDVSVTRSAENAKSLLKASSDYMAAQKAFSFDYDTYLEVVTKENQKLGLASSGTMTVQRPNKLRAVRTGGFASVEFVYDGKTVTMLGKNANAYTQVEAAGTIDQLVDNMRTKYGRPLPGADLLMSNLYDQLMPEVVDVKDLGSGMINGAECDHLAFRTKDVDWEIWIAQGSSPYPCRYVVTSTQMNRAPQYSIELRTWKAGAALASDAFAFKVPANARKVNASDLRDFDELPSIFSIRKTAGRPMTMVKRIRTLLLAAMLGVLCLELSERFLPPGMFGFVSSVEAVVGRPLTPVSVTGVARRTARRCSADVYDC